MLDGDDLRSKPLAERKAALRKLLRRTRGGIQYVKHVEGDRGAPFDSKLGPSSRRHREIVCNLVAIITVSWAPRSLRRTNLVVASRLAQMISAAELVPKCLNVGGVVLRDFLGQCRRVVVGISAVR